MTKEEILAIQESDKEGCEALNKSVHEKLGLCWHERVFKASNDYFDFTCIKCGDRYFEKEVDSDHPDYCHSIEACWQQIKEYLDKEHEHGTNLVFFNQLHKISNGWLIWASPLDRVKTFLTM